MTTILPTCTCDPNHLELGAYDTGCPRHDSAPPRSAGDRARAAKEAAHPPLPVRHADGLQHRHDVHQVDDPEGRHDSCRHFLGAWVEGPATAAESRAIRRVDRYTISIDDVRVTANESQERRIRDLTPAQLHNFVRIFSRDDS